MSIQQLSASQITLLLLITLIIAAVCEVRCAAAAANDDDDDDVVDDEDYNWLTFGSAVRLVHRSSRYHLHSHGINYGSGSGQQSVTAVTQDDDTNSLWQLKEAYSHTPIALGTPVKCGDVVRLQHVLTRRYLHSHLHTSPLSNRQEVSAYGEGSHSDSGDIWKIECSGESFEWDRIPVGTSLSAGSSNPAVISFLHLDTNKRLYTRKSDEFNQQNCRGCPIVGQLEVSAATAAATDQSTQFIVQYGGILFPLKKIANKHS